jgi:hypothetical protein
MKSISPCLGQLSDILPGFVCELPSVGNTVYACNPSQVYNQLQLVNVKKEFAEAGHGDESR